MLTLPQDPKRNIQLLSKALPKGCFFCCPWYILGKQHETNNREFFKSTYCKMSSKLEKKQWNDPAKVENVHKMSNTKTSLFFFMVRKSFLSLQCQAVPSESAVNTPPLWPFSITGLVNIHWENSGQARASLTLLRSLVQCDFIKRNAYYEKD